MPIEEFKAKTPSPAMDRLKILDDDTALLAIEEGGATALQMQQHFGWKSQYGHGIYFEN